MHLDFGVVKVGAVGKDAEHVTSLHGVQHLFLDHASRKS